MSSILYDAMMKAEQEHAPQSTLEQILFDVEDQIAQIEYVNTQQKCYDKVQLSVEDMKFLLGFLNV